MCLTAFKAVIDWGKEDEEEEENNNDDRKIIRRPQPSDSDTWNALPHIPTQTEVGYLHVSFEYHRGSLRVRVWEISDLILPPPQISMIYSIYVRGYFLPDKVKKTHRRTEDVLVHPPDKKGVDTPKSGIQHIFTPSAFKFRTPLMYTGMTMAIIKERSIQLEVCMTHKHTQQVYLMAMLHMPLRTALRRPIREKYPLIPCLNHTIPNNMRVYSATALQLHHSKPGNAVSNGNLSNAAVESLISEHEADLEDAVSMSGEDFLRSHLSLCLDEDSDEDVDEGNVEDENGDDLGNSLTVSQISSGVGSAASSSSTNTLNNPSSGDDVGDNDYNDDDEQFNDSASAASDLQNFRSTPLDGSLSNLKDVDSSSKRRIIPNELLQEDEEADGDMSHDSGLIGIVEEDFEKGGNLEGSLEGNPVLVEESGSSGIRDYSGLDSQNSYNVENVHESDNNHALENQDGITSDDGATSGRKKIIPAGVDIPTLFVEDGDEQESTPHKNLPRNHEMKTSENGDSQASDTQSSHNENSYTPVKKKKIAVNPEKINLASENSPPKQASKHSQDSSGPINPDSLPHHTLAPDSGFTPASRPETPCWDFYDFSEDLKPEGELELGEQELEDSLSQLRQHGIGSLQNLSLEPVLPMVLVDDFDTLTVED